MKKHKKGMVLPFALAMIFFLSSLLLTGLAMQNVYLRQEAKQTETMKDYVKGGE